MPWIFGVIHSGFEIHGYTISSTFFFLADALGLLLLKRTLKKKFCNKQEENFFHFAGLVLADWGVRGTLTM